ncbi:MAG: hypothetical protein PSV36_12715 [Algoriphagus sp.]|nr:hypothetical protein [Algoriphagus sp.]
MKIWKSLLILLSTLLLIGAGFWVYKKYFSSRKINNLELISQEAVFVLETYQGAKTWNTLVNDPVWEILSTLPAFQKFSTQLTTLDSLSGGSGEITKTLSGKQMTVSLHTTGIETFDLLFTVNLNSKRALALIEEVKSRMNPGAKFQSRNYSEIEILEYYDASNNRLWSLSILEDLILVSSSSFLVEEAIRFYINEGQQSFSDLAASTPYDKDSPGRLLLSGKGMASLLKGVTTDRENQSIAALETLTEGLVLDLAFEEGQLVFKGPLVSEKGVNFTPSIRANLPAIESIISNRTLALTQYNLESIYETQKLENRAFTPRSTLSGEIQRTLTDKGFLDSFTGEIYLLDLENSGGSDQNLAILARSTDPTFSLELIKEYQQEAKIEASDFYLGHEILYLAEEEFPAHLFAGKFPGFGQTFVTALEEVLVFTNSQQAMKLILDDFESENTWGKSAQTPEAKNGLSPTSGFTRLYLIDQIWENWTKTANPSWSSFLQKYSTSFRSFPWVSLKINQIQDKTEATLTFPYKSEKKAKTPETEAISLQPSKNIPFKSTLIYGPKSVINFQDETEDILVQDTDNVLHLINSGGEEVFAIKLSGPIVSDAFQIDYYKNGKLQILLATEEKIYGIDRLGDLLPSYPFDLGGESISHLNLVDYSNDKDYRYFISTADGDLYLLDKNGKQLEGWDPLKLGEKTIAPPAHYRVPGRGDYMIAQTEKGKLHLFTRRGEKQAGSPIQLGESLKSRLAVWQDPKAKSFQLVGITANGEVIHSNFSGEVGYRNQLIKDDRDSEFLLIQDQKGNDFVFVSRQFNNVSVMDRAEKILFTTKVSDENLIYQYFDFGSNRQIFALTDLVQEFCYLYDMKGNLLTKMPLESTGPIQITHQVSQGQFLIRTISGAKLTEFQLAD